MSNQPAHEVRLGCIRATIWANETDEGIRHSAIFTRLYKNAEQWQDAGTFGCGHLLLVAKVADMAHSWIMQQHSD